MLLILANTFQSECLTKTYNLLSLISFNLEELVTADISDVKEYAKVIVNNFNTLVDVLLQVWITHVQRQGHDH